MKANKLPKSEYFSVYIAIPSEIKQHLNVFFQDRKQIKKGYWIGQAITEKLERESQKEEKQNA